MDVWFIFDLFKMLLEEAVKMKWFTECWRQEKKLGKLYQCGMHGEAWNGFR